MDESQQRDSPELKHLRKYGFFVTECVPFLQVCIAEELAMFEGRKYDTLFRKGSKNYYKRWDEKRKISYIVGDDPLYQLITEPVKRMMTRLGLLDVCGSEEGLSRVIGDCGALKSLKQRIEVLQGLQGMHADTPPGIEWGNDVAFSTITAGSQPAALDIYPMSWDGGRGFSKVPVQVVVPPGHTIVFHGVARHRGVSYSYVSLRFFINFLVKVAAERAEETTSVLEKWRRPEGEAISFDAWKKEFEG